MMRYLALLIFCAGACLPRALFAENCEVNAYDAPLPGARDIRWRTADVPAARHPSEWQEGIFQGFSYKIFAQDQALLGAAQADSSWSIEIDCTQGAAICQLHPSEDAPAAAQVAAQSIAVCLLGGADEIPSAEAAPAASIEVASDLAIDAPSEHCHKAKVPDGSAILTLQRLLLIAGHDPGAIDGLIGPATRRAVQSALPDLGPDFGPEPELDETLKRLRILICAG